MRVEARDDALLNTIDTHANITDLRDRSMKTGGHEAVAPNHVSNYVFKTITAIRSSTICGVSPSLPSERFGGLLCCGLVTVSG